MPLTLATLLLFFALTPGAVFLLGIRLNRAAVSAKDVFDSPTQEIISLLCVSFTLVVSIFSCFLYFQPTLVDFWLINLRAINDMPLTALAIGHLLYPASLFTGCVYLVSYLLGKFFPTLRFGFDSKHKIHSSTLRKFLYHINNDEMLFAWILTKTSYDNKHLMYLGLVRSVKLDQDSIVQVAINYPSKTYIDFDKQLRLVHEDDETPLPRDLTNLDASIENILYIPHDNISNIYFEKFSTDPGKSKSMLKAVKGIFSGSPD